MMILFAGNQNDTRIVIFVKNVCVRADSSEFKDIRGLNAML